MTQTAPASAPLSEKSIAVVGATIGGLVVVTLVCKAANVTQEISGVVSGSAGLIPGAIAYGLQRRRSRVAVSTGQATGWRPPLPALIAVLFGITVYIVDSLLGILFTYGPTYLTVIFFLAFYYTLTGMAAGLLSFLFVRRPYLWLVLVSVGIAFALRVFTMILFAGDIAALDTYQYQGAAFATVFAALVGYVLMFGVVAAGVAIATRHRAAFLARRLSPTAVSTTLPAATQAPAPASAPASVKGKTPAPPVPAAGWYPDPDLRGIERWWDGTAWTDERRNIPGPVA